MALPIDTSAEAIQAQLANAQFNAANAAYDPGSAAALAVLQNTNPSLYLQAVGHAAAVDAAAEAAKHAAAFGNQLGGVDPTTLANMTKSEIAARYGSNVADAVGDYYIANPSARFRGEIAHYGMEHTAIIGSSGRLTPAEQLTFQPYNTEATTRMLQQQQAIAPLVVTNAPVTSAPISSGAEATPLFEDISSWFRSAPILGSVYEAGASYPGRAAVGEFVKTTPGLSTIYTGGQIYEGRSDVARQQELASTIYNRDLSGGLITPSGTFVGTSSQYSDLISSKNLADTMAANQKTFETPLLGNQVAPWTMPLASWATGASQYITDTGKYLMGAADTALPAAAPLTHFAVGVGEGVASIVPFAALTIPAIEWAGRNPAVFAATAVPGLVSQGAGMATQAAQDPFQFAGNMVGMVATGKVIGGVYERQPYRVGIERAEIVPSTGEGGARAGYSSLAVTKLSGKDYQISQIDKALVGIGGKTVSPVDVVLNSDLLKTTIDARFTTKESTFTTANEALAHFYEVSQSPSSFYHATTTGNIEESLISGGSMKVGGKTGALFFAEPGTILTKYATGPGVPIALKLTGIPEITPKFLEVVTDIKSGRAKAYGPGFVEAAKQLPEGFYPGLRPAAGKAFGTYGLEEEYIVSPGTTLYLKSLRSAASPSGEPWLLAEVSLRKPLLPDITRGAVQLGSDISNLRPFIGVPKVPEEYFKFGEGKTFAAQTPLETSIVKRLAPEEAPKIDLGYGVRQITSGSGMRLQNAATAINEVVKSRGLPHPDKVTEAILQTEIDYEVKMYGSSIQRGAGTEQGIVTLTRAPNDIDIYVPESGGQSMGQSFAGDVTKAINRAAGKVVVEVDRSGTVSFVDGSGKLFDIHNENPTVEELLSQGSNPNKMASVYYGIGMKVEAPIESSEGVGLMTYSEQVGRKLSGTSEFTLEPRTTISKYYEGGPEEFSVTGRIGPRMEGRMKDIPDFYTGEKGNIALMQRSMNPVTRMMAEQANVMLEDWLNTWGEGAAKNIRESYQRSYLANENKYALDFSDMIKTGTDISSQGQSIRSGLISGSSAAVSLSLRDLSSEPLISPSASSQSVSHITGVPSAYSLSQTRPSESPISGAISLTPSPYVDLPSLPERYSIDISRGVSFTPSVTPEVSTSLLPSAPPSPLSGLSVYLSGLLSPPPSPPTPSPISPPPSPPPSPEGGGWIWGGEYTIIPPPPSSDHIYKRKRKQQPYYVFREILPVITPIEEMSGFKSGKSFFRAIGNQQILEVKPQQRDWLHYVDVDVDIRELEQKSQDTASRTSDLAGMSFFRTATKQEKAKTGKPILKYIPTKQEISIATLAGIRNTKPRGGKKNPWF